MAAPTRTPNRAATQHHRVQGDATGRPHAGRERRASAARHTDSTTAHPAPVTGWAYPYTWTWRHRTTGTGKAPWFPDGVDRTGRHCRVIARGTMNTAWIQFEDGYQTITSRGGLRRRTTP